MNTQPAFKRFNAFLLSIVLFALPLAATAQIPTVKAPSNKYKVQDDVKLGNDAAREIDQQFPILADRTATEYVERVGERLVAQIPSNLRQPAFDYRFKIVDASDLNAFALPGGPMYVNRGMIELARNEGEMAGVMAHEISHVALRHATAQATKQSSAKNTLGMLGMIIGGAILGGQTGAQIGMLGAQAWMTKYSREYETQSDELGAIIMAKAGYDPRDLANVFQTIAQQGGRGGPEWLSSHPDPGNRFQKINQLAARLPVSSNPLKITRDFESVQARLRSMPPARTMAQIQQDYERNKGGGTTIPTAGGRYSSRVQYPSTRMRAYTGHNWMRVNVPTNWGSFGSGDNVQFAPEGAYGNQGITHGAMLGIYQGQTRDLARDTQSYIQAIAQANPYLRQQSQLTRGNIAGRQAYAMQLGGTSPITRQTELVTIYTTQLRSGEILYIATVVPQSDASRYSSTFQNMLRSVQLYD